MAVFDLGKVVFEKIPVSYNKVAAGEHYLQVTVGGGGPDTSRGYMEVIWGVTDEFNEFDDPSDIVGSGRYGLLPPIYDSLWSGHIMLMSMKFFRSEWKHDTRQGKNNVFLKAPVFPGITIYKVVTVDGVRV